LAIVNVHDDREGMRLQCAAGDEFSGEVNRGRERGATWLGMLRSRWNRHSSYDLDHTAIPAPAVVVYEAFNTASPTDAAE
jgi:hypothetical protein